MHVVGLMAEGQWVSGVTHAELAKKWGITPITVTRIAGEAGRILRRDLGHVREQADRWLVVHEQMLKDAINRGDHEIAARIAGTALRTLLPMTVTLKGAATESTEDMIARAREVLGVHQRERQALAEAWAAEYRGDGDPKRQQAPKGDNDG
jgi:hypothetical protein